MRPEVEQELSHVLLTELLAYQFASPVRWIETQDVFLRDQKTERIVEIGPSPTLAGMASRTIKAKYESYDAALSLQRQVLCYSKDTKEIYYTPDPVAPEPEAAPEAATPAVAPAAAGTPAPAAPVAPAAAPAGPVADVPDEPVKASQVIHTLVAHKLKKSLDAVPMSKAIKDLVGGKSTVQNEILGDLGKEFGSTPEKPEETPLQELAEQFQDTFNGQLGKQTSSLIARLTASKMPGGFSVSTARKYLQSRWGLGPGRQDSVLLLALTEEPAQRLGAEADAKGFFDTVAQKYASSNGVTLAQASSGGDGGAGSGGAMVDPAALDAITKDQKVMARRQLEVLARYLKVDLESGTKTLVKEREATKALQAELDLWGEEHGEFYATGIKPAFSPLKARKYDSYWNWVRQDVLTMYYDIIFGRLKSVDRETVSQCLQIMNRANPTLIKFMQYHIDHCPSYKGETYELAKKLGQQLIDNCEQVLAQSVAPVYKEVSYPTGPQTSIDARGNVSYEEVSRPAVNKLEHYVHEMARGGESTRVAVPSIQEDLARVYRALNKQASTQTRLEVKKLYSQLVEYIEQSQEIEVDKSARSVLGDETSSSSISSDSETDEIASLPQASTIPDPVSTTLSHETIPFLHLKKRTALGDWVYDRASSGAFLDGLERGAVNGISFKGKHVLVTGAGPGSIGAELLQGLLSGGATCVVTTSRFSKKVTEYYQQMYSRFGAAGAQLVVVPFNQGSKTDVEALVDYIYSDEKAGGLGWDLDAVIPFAAIPEGGIEIDGIGSKSELAHRIMLTNVLRLLGEVKKQKSSRNINTRPAQVILPLSPNHGIFGGDGLYSESKLGLETLFNRWHSESWHEQLTVCGAIIGWTRGTGLMSANNIVAEGIEKYGVRTFSQKEMAFNLLGLMTPEITSMCQDGPVVADLNGGLQFLENLREKNTDLRVKINETSAVRRAVAQETAIDTKTVRGESADLPYRKYEVEPRSNMTYAFPTLKKLKDIRATCGPELEGLLDLERVIVVTGFSEVGPWGSARTRWEMEAYGEFSLEGCIEMAWVMGLIKYHNAPIKGKPYTGWVDAKSGEPVRDLDVKTKYESQVLEHSGIRLIEPELFHGYDPNKKEMIQEVVIQHDLEPFATDAVTAKQFAHQHGDKVEVLELEGDEFSVRFLSGAKLFVPKALRFDRLVAGQVPTGWDARRYGIPEDTIDQVDPITLYVLVATCEALLSSGVTDPYEFYKYVHVSEVGNCSGSGMGGVSALRGMFKDRYSDRPVQNDILQESFINTMSAWVNMLLLSSSGPIKTPVGACATAVESVDVGAETILSGKAKICLVGGYDDFQEEGSYEFANMNATSNSLDEMAHGRTPAEMSRPTTTTRNGFMEAQGSGMQVIMTADLALKMGVPIYAIVAMTATATDKIGRSVPAPGKGILTTAREHQNGSQAQIMDIKYRARQLRLRASQISQWHESELEYLRSEVTDPKELESRAEELQRDAAAQLREAKNYWGNQFFQRDPRVAPLRGALAAFNLTVDDLGVASFHGTSTKANDKNESATINLMMEHLGRSKGNPVFGVFQKYLTGHPKGAAGAWMLNGAIQIMQSGLVPGNRNADNVDHLLEEYEYVLYPNRAIQTDGIKAVSVTSFGFGQKGAQAVVIHPDYLYAALDESTYNSYAEKVEARHKKAYRYMHNAVIRNTMFVAKDQPPYTPEMEQPVYLDPLARIGESVNVFKSKDVQRKDGFVSASARDTATALANAASSVAGGKGVGVDVELISAINTENDTFMERNFTSEEISYCSKAACPRSSFAGTWSAKEAVFKALGVASKGAGAALKEIEVSRDSTGAPSVKLVGGAKSAADAAGVKNVKVSISHDDVQSVAVAVSEF